MYVINANYGDASIAVIQWAYEQKLEDVYVVSIDTGWAAPEWQQRVNQAEELVKQCQFNVVRLHSKLTFAELVKERGSFPNKQFQWCAGFLKGLAIIEWLDKIDPACEATIILGKRRVSSRAYQNLPEYIELSERYGDRRVWHPLYLLENGEHDALIQHAGFELLGRRSLECDPCIHNMDTDFLRMQQETIEHTAKLEADMDKPMFAAERYADSIGIKNVVNYVKQQHEKNATDNIKSNKSFQDAFNMGCGDPFGCGE